MKKFLRTKLFLSLIIIAVLNFSCSSDDGVNITPLPEMDLVEVAQSKSEIATLVSALQQANLTSTLQGTAQYTILAPTDAAFSTFLSANGFGSISDVPSETLTQILLNHVVTGLVDAANLNILQKNYLETLADGPGTGTKLALYFDASNGVIFNGNATVSEADVLASNGVIHIVNSVIALPTIETFISTDENFEDLDTAFDLISPVSTLPQTIKEAESGPFTLFAPAVEAFDALLESNEDWDFLSDIDEDLLTSVLEHHVLNGNTDSSELTAEATFTTLEGDDITLNSIDGEIAITDGSGNSGIIIAQEIQGIQAINGIIHILPEKVMIPDTGN